jgi:hypothetical protein
MALRFRSAVFLPLLLGILQVTLGAVIIKDLNDISSEANDYDFIIIGGKQLIKLDTDRCFTQLPI